jgi:hypothetical protein
VVNSKNALKLCLARFDELKSIGLEALTKKHDPYWDIPLDENRPQAVIKLRGVASLGEEKSALHARRSQGRSLRSRTLRLPQPSK